MRLSQEERNILIALRTTSPEIRDQAYKLAGVERDPSPARDNPAKPSR